MSDKTNNEKLFDEFPPISTEAWEALIREDLKGADYEKKLVWKTVEGLKLKPYYRAEHLENLDFTKTIPEHAPFVRGNRKDNNWIIRQDIDEESPLAANAKAHDALKRGAEAIALNVSSCKKTQDLVNLLKGIDLNIVNIHYFGASSYLQLADLLVKASKVLDFDSKNLKGSFNFDNLGYFLAHGSFYASMDSNFVELSQLFDIAKRDFPLIKIINVNAQLIHNSGGSLTQELAFSLAIGTEYITNLVSKGQPVDDVLSRIQFTYAIGSNYFLEIAKIRAARLLWSAITAEFKPLHESSKYMTIHSTTSLWNKTIFDSYVNLLRCTTEAMSAAIGGCDSMTVLPFDIAYKSGDIISNRIARNIQIILKEEAYFNKIADAAAGSYYVENLTESIAEASWQLFLDIESKGGFIEAANNGAIDEAIEIIAARKQEDLAMRRQILLGTNQYPNYAERMLGKIEPLTKASALKGKKTNRLAHSFEALRLAVEDYINKGNCTPKVFLLNIGSLSMRKARAGFAVNFFTCASYEVIDNNGFKTPEEGIKAALESKAKIICICSSDEEYATLGVEIVQHIKKADKDKIVIIAGNPAASVEILKQAGVDEFIHVKTNVLTALGKLNSMLGVI